MLLNQVIGIEKEEANPVGEVKEVPEIDVYVQALTEEWDKVRGERVWWKFWQKTASGVYKATRFLLNSLDGLIILIDDLVDLGPDKESYRHESS